MKNDEIEATTKDLGKNSLPVDLEFEHYLFEVYLNDRIENEIQRMMEFYNTPAEPLST
jgi:hypothetical protein